MNYDEKIKELSNRIEVLEKAENKRVLKKKIEITLQVVKVLVVVIIIFIAYVYVNNKFIKPYKEKIDYVEEKVNNVESFVQEKWEFIKKYNPFK